MTTKLKHLASPSLVVACICLVVALGGVSYAAGVLPANSVGAKQLRASAVTPSKISPKTIALLKGQQSRTRTTAHTAAARNSLFANLTGNGVLESGTATAARQLSEGAYLVSFARDVSSCAAVASPGPTQTGSTAPNANGVTHVGDDSFANNEIEVDFYKPDPTSVFAPVNTDFHLIVAC
jgi:hypothetical protein